MAKPVVFISSTCEDLQRTGYRDAARDAANRAGFYAEMQEYFLAKDNPPLKECLARVKGARLLVVVVAYRFGWVPEKQRQKDPAKRKSITWLECEKARKDGKDVLAFLVDTSHPWLEELHEDYTLTKAVREGKSTDRLRKDAQWKSNRLEEFKEWLRTTGICESFTTPEDLRGKIEGALLQWRLVHLPAVSAADQYLLALRHDTSHIDIRGLQIASGTAQRFPIDDLYIPLTTVLADETKSPCPSHRGKKPAQAQLQGRKPMELQGALKHRKLVVLGDPGAGKTTFVRRIAYALCNSRLGISGGSTAQALGLRQQPFPILIRVFELAEHIDRCATPAQAELRAPTSPGWLSHFLADASARAQTGLGRDFFDDLLAAGPAVVLVDGLDEAPTTKHRENIAALVTEAARRFKKCRFVVTSRPPAYAGKAVLPKFAHAWIDPLEEEAIKGFLTRWCRALFDAGDKQSLEHCEELLRVIQGRVEIRRIARNPVMLTALAVVHWHEKRLPEQRADLYESIITWLSRSRKRWEGRLAPEICVSRLQELALAMQSHRKGRQVQVSRRWAAEQIAGEWPDGSERKRIETADTFLREDEIDSGIVVSRGDDIRFWHLTFQEFLAARAIAARSEKEQKAILLTPPGDPPLYSPGWREVVLLLAGVLYKQGYRKVDTSVSAVLEGVCDGGTLADQARCAGLLGAAVRDLAAVGYRPADPRYQQLFDRVMGIFDPQRAKGIDIKVIIEAAEALGQAGDPRFTDAARADNWVTIPAGEFLMGAQKDDPSKPNFDSEAYGVEAPVHLVTLEAYRIGRYPVTVGEFLRFLEAEGYENRDFWPEEGFGKWPRPEGWEEQLEHPTRPVTGVSWYEAAAYAAWMEGRLPTEAEWERAARGPQGRRHPWGDEQADPSRLNYYESKIGCPTPVGVYARGATPEGILDMAGNVFEWCSDWFGNYPKTSVRDPKGPPSGPGRVLRGGSWSYGAWRCRSAFRCSLGPQERYGDVGFRVVSVSVGLGLPK